MRVRLSLFLLPCRFFRLSFVLSYTIATDSRRTLRRYAGESNPGTLFYTPRILGANGAPIAIELTIQSRHDVSSHDAGHQTRSRRRKARSRDHTAPHHASDARPRTCVSGGSPGVAPGYLFPFDCSPAPDGQHFLECSMIPHLSWSLILKISNVLPASEHILRRKRSASLMQV